MSRGGAKVVTLVDRGRGKRGGGSEGGGGGDLPDSDWLRLLTRNRDGKVEGTLHNIITVLEHDDRLKGLFWLNDSSNQVVMSRAAPWPGCDRSEYVDGDSAELAAWLQHPDRYGMRCSDDTVHVAVLAVARRHRRHPIREYLSALRWDGVPRVETMLIDSFGVNDTRYARQVALCFMVGAVARILWIDPKNPQLGAKVDFMLVLEGPEGFRKSTIAMELFGSQWFVETMESPTDKDFYQVLQGCWGVEIGELVSFGKSQSNAVLVAVTRRSDKFRAPYDRLPKVHRRESMFIGTTNESEYIRTPSGGRRYLPVVVSRVADPERVARERDQLWAEAVQMFRDGFEYWNLPDDARAEQAARYMSDSWEGRIERWLSGRFRKDGNGMLIVPNRLVAFDGKPIPWTTTDELLEYAVGVDPARHSKADQMRVSAIMRRMGSDPLPGESGNVDDSWEHCRKRWPDGGREWRWVRVTREADQMAGCSQSSAGVEVGDDPDF